MITDDQLVLIEKSYHGIPEDVNVLVLVAEIRRLRGVLHMIATTQTINAAELRVIELARAALNPRQTNGNPLGFVERAIKADLDAKTNYPAKNES